MSERRGKARWIIAGFTLTAIPILYVAGYFALSRNFGVESPIREFQSRGLAMSYLPLALIESWMRRCQVGIAMPDRAGTPGAGEIIFAGHNR